MSQLHNSSRFILPILFIGLVLYVIASRTLVFSVLGLILVFLCFSGILLTLGCEYLALLYIVIYVGAVLVLFLWIVMTIPLKKDSFLYNPNEVALMIFFTIVLFAAMLFWVYLTPTDLFAALPKLSRDNHPIIVSAFRLRAKQIVFTDGWFNQGWFNHALNRDMTILAKNKQTGAFEPVCTYTFDPYRDYKIYNSAFYKMSQSYAFAMLIPTATNEIYYPASIQYVRPKFAILHYPPVKTIYDIYIAALSQLPGMRVYDPEYVARLEKPYKTPGNLQDELQFYIELWLLAPRYVKFSKMFTYVGRDVPPFNLLIALDNTPKSYQFVAYSLPLPEFIHIRSVSGATSRDPKLFFYLNYYMLFNYKYNLHVTKPVFLDWLGIFKFHAGWPVLPGNSAWYLLYNFFKVDFILTGLMLLASMVASLSIIRFYNLSLFNYQ